MRTIELFNQDKLYHIVENPELYSQFLQYEDNVYDPIKSAKKYLSKSVDGVTKVKYHQVSNKNEGRWFANDSCSMQNLSRQIRHTIGGEYYTDVDMVNAHPVILLWYCQQYGFDCSRLQEYVTHRDKHIAELMDCNQGGKSEYDTNMTRDKAKQVFLSLLNGGVKDYNNVKVKTKFLKRFKSQITSILEDVCEEFKSRFEENKEANKVNPVGSTVNKLLCKKENEILMCMLDYLRERKSLGDNMVLCFDGIMVPKTLNISDTDLKGLEEYIKLKCKIYIKLKIKEMDEGLNIPEDIKPYNIYKPFNPDDSFTWFHFDEKYRGHAFSSLDDVIEKTKVDLNRVFCSVLQGSGFHVKKTDCEDNIMDIIDANKQHTDLYFSYYEAETKKTKEIDFKRYVKVFASDLMRYQSIGFKPNSKNTHLFNLWTGFKAHDIDCDNYDSLDKILWHIRHIYCRDDERTYNYFMELISYILTYPERASKIVTFIYSERQGSGKNCIMDFFQKHVFGDRVTFYSPGIDSVLEKHNHLMKNKKVCVVDELSSTGNNWMGDFNKLKSMITAPVITINPKSNQQYQIDNVLSWFMISNYEDAIRLEKSDRRYFCLNVSEEKVNDVSYFNELINTFTDDNGDLFMSYVKKYHPPPTHMPPPPRNKFKQSIQQNCYSTSIKFVMEHIDTKDDEFEPVIKKGDLFKLYVQWCSDTRDKCKSRNNFYKDVYKHVKIKQVKGIMHFDLSTFNI